MRQWENRGPILRCPYCRHRLVYIFKGRGKLRGPTKREIAEAGADDAIQ